MVLFKVSYIKWGVVISIISHTNIVAKFRRIILGKRNTFVNKQNVNLCAVQRSTETTFLHVVFRTLRHKVACYSDCTMAMAHYFFTKFHIFCHTHTLRAPNLALTYFFLLLRTTYRHWQRILRGETDKVASWTNRVAFRIL
jgi:hypothetical protein